MTVQHAVVTSAISRTSRRHNTATSVILRGASASTHIRPVGAWDVIPIRAGAGLNLGVLRNVGLTHRAAPSIRPIAWCVVANSWGANTISELPADRFELLRPIPVVYTEWGGSVVVGFEEADVSIAGSSREDAHDLLAHWMVDLFGDLLDEPPKTLGRDLTHKLTVLRKYIRRVDD